jgi:hypothetical protein
MLRRYFLAGLAGLPATLDDRRGVHPRLFFDGARLEQLRAAAAGSHAAVWKPIREQADAIASRRPPQYRETDEEELWQRDVGSSLPFLALAHCITGEAKYLQAAREWSLASCDYPRWGTRRFLNTDLAAGHQLFGLACVYDWLYGHLDAETKAVILDRLLKYGAFMQEGCRKMYWANQYLQNHLWVNITGLAAAGMAIFDEPGAGEPAKAWVDLVLKKYRRTEEALGPDGASHEGVGYWTYGVEYMLKFWHLAEDLLGEKLSSPWWRSTAMYRLYMSLPRKAWTPRNTIIDIGDNPRYDWYGPDYLLRRLAAMYRDPYAQHLAAELERAGATGWSARWLNLLWYDRSVAEKPPADLPTLRHFDDLGLVSARTGWDGDEALLVFKSGPPIGREATRNFDYDPGAGHVHPDCNHFVLFGAGEWLLRDDGYAWKQTDTHNTLLVDGKGQLGEGRQWFSAGAMVKRRLDPRILLAKSAPALDEIHGDAAPMYPEESGVRRFVRRVYFMKPDVVVVADDIETTGERALEVRFHPESRGVLGDDGAAVCRGERATLRIEPLTGEGVEITAGDLPARERHGEPSTMFTVRLAARRQTWRNAVALSWAPAGKTPPRVTMQGGAEAWTFRAGGRSATCRWT